MRESVMIYCATIYCKSVKLKSEMIRHFSLFLYKLLCLVSFVVLTQFSNAQTHTARTVNIPNANCNGYYEYLPINYNTNTTTKYPLLIYIHGNGAYGNGSASAMNIVLQEGVPRVINLGQFPTTFTVNGQPPTSYIVISPQFLSRASPAQTRAFIDYILSRNLRIDLNRVYVTGFSVGGDVAWKTPMNLASAARLAALVPVAGYNNPYSDTTAQFIVGARLPVWAIHSNSDGVPVAWSQNMVDKINSLNPVVPAIISRPNGITHENTHIVVYAADYKPNGKNIYEWCLQYSRNLIPVANAGNDQSITLPDTDANLSSAGSSDPEGSPLTYNWSKISGPSQFLISNTTAANPVVSNLVAGVYNFQLQVTDNNGLTDLDTVKITVINPNPNQLPIADAGNDATIFLPQTSVALGGNGSFDPNGIIETYKWRKISGPSQFTITDSNSVNTNINNLKVGVYEFRLTITDNEGGSTSDTVEITVINPFPNVLPVARAGTDKEITLPVNTSSLSGSTSSDADGSIISYQWKQVAGPTASVLSTPTLVNTNVSNLTAAGTYQFELMVTDDSTGTNKDTVQVIVYATLPPSQNVVKVNVYGGSFPAGTGWNNWNVQNNLTLPSTLNENGTTSPVTANLAISNAIADNGATYPVTMCPVEVGRTTSYSTVTRLLTISGLTNTKKYNLELYSSRSGTGNSTRFVISGTTVTVNSSNNYAAKASFTNLTPVSGQIKVSIERVNTYNYINGFIISEVVTGGGGPTPNEVPVAVPGTNQTITLPTSQVTLNGSASYDTDGSVSSYLWEKLSGPSAAITNAANVSTTVTGLSAGIYVFQLTVKDNLQAVGTATVQVTVNEAYVAPSGSDSINCGKVFKIVILGSSTAVGTGSNPIDSAWVYKFRAYVRGKNVQSQVISLAASGFTTYHTLNPTGYTPPAGRPAPDTARNITKALAQNPDLIIINLPSNDNAGGYSVQEQKDNYERAMGLINARNIPVFVSTTQPRNSLTPAQMSNQITMRDWTYQRFGEKAIDFWTTIANPDGTINELYNSDGIHLKNAGHHILYTRVIAERVLDTLCLRKNIAPVVNAGNNVTIFLPTDSVQLSSAGTSDPDGSIASYNWSKISGPTQFAFSSQTVANPKLRNLTLGVYKIELSVKDNYGVIVKDTVTITVNTVDPLPPIANAGSPLTITLPLDSLLLSSTGSSDPDGSITGYRWKKIAGPDSYAFADSLIASPRVRNLVVGVYQFELTVTDNTGLTGKDSVTVTVLKAPNQVPVANAGTDMALTYPVNSIQLNGSLSVDNDGNIAAYRWKKVSGPAAYAIDDSTIVNPMVGVFSPGVYIIELMVTDNEGATDRDSVTIITPFPPIANAGSPVTIALPKDSVLLSSTGSSDPDGVITGYHWTKIAGSDNYSFEDSLVASARVRALSVGVYTFELTVTDNSGMTGKDSVTVTVLPVPNQLPVANAGIDITLDYPGNSTPLDGSLSVDNDGNIASYRWKKITGPVAYTINDSTIVNPTISGLTPGTYTIELLVTDNEGATGKDSVKIIVGSPPNQLPVANAGADRYLVMPASSVQLNGTGSGDTDGTITYNWSKVSGPASFSINNASAISPTISNLSVGVYMIQLIVTDNNLATHKDSVTVTVYPPLNTVPVARAGNDQSITLPVNSVSLSGSTSSDANGSIIIYQWSQVSGPSAAVFSTPALVNTNAGSLVAGLYKFELKVTDDSTTFDTDTVNITVNPAPTEKFIKVNIYGGTIPAGTGWVNWNVQSNLTLTSPAYSDGTASTVTAVLSYSNAIADNGATYPVTMCPVEVGRTTSYSTLARWMTLSGLNNTKRYNLEVYGSRSGSGNSTRYIVGTTTIIIDNGNNYTNKALFTNIAPVSGQIRIEIQRMNTYNYINGFILTETTPVAGRQAGSDIVTEQPDAAATTESVTEEKKPAIPEQPFGLFPNPVAGKPLFQLNNKHTGNLKVTVMNQDGKPIRAFQFIKSSELFRQQLPLQDLAPGIYFIQAKMNGWRETGKLIKL
jgi:lysophospholipase L1-like esterase/PKD repeat protein